MKHLNKYIILFFFISLFLLSSCHVARFFYWNFANINDYKKFPSLKINHQKNTFKFFETDSNIFVKIPGKFIEKNYYESFERFLKDNKTISFLIIRNDTILYEKYFSDFNKESINSSFSVSKVYVSALVGIAIDEGYLQDVKQAVTDFFPEIKNKGFDKITIEHLLNMRSGIKFNEGYINPFGDMAKFY